MNEEEDNNINELLSEIELSNKEVETVIEKSKEIEKVDPTSLQYVSGEILKKINTNERIADEIYQLFYRDLALGKDHSSSSKESLLRSLELRVESSKVAAELAKAIVKKETAAQQTKAGVGVFINTQSARDVGIDLKNIEDEL